MNRAARRAAAAARGHLPKKPAARRSSPNEYGPVGQCIYCGDSNPPLFDEHILPAGLGGRLILLEASCLTCQKITSSIERIVLREIIGPIRYGLKLGNKKHKSRASSFELRITKLDGSQEVKSFGALEYPPSLLLLSLPPPNILVGAPPPSSFNTTPWFYHATPSHLVASGVTQYEREHKFHGGYFMRMLAKIAHGLAVAHLGVGGFKPLLPNVILKPGPNNVVGGDPTPHPPDPHLHNAILKRVEAQGRTYLVADIRLFARLGSPLYSIVVGELPTTEPSATSSRP